MAWPSSYPPQTMGYMIDQIDDELKRQGLINDRIQNAIIKSIETYQRERFRFNETFTTSFLTVGGQQNYNIFSDVGFPAVAGPLQIYKIDWMTITIPPAVFDVPREDPEQILILTQTGTQMGQPYLYAFANEQIMLYPIPTTGTPGTGPVSFLTSLVGGSGYTPGVYSAIPATGGHGAGLTLNVTVNSFGNVQSTSIANGGFGYQVGDVVGMVLGIGSGFQETISAVNATGQGPFLMSIGGHVTYAAPGTYAGYGGISTVGIDNAGSAYTNGTYTNVPLTGGTGSGALATVIVSGNAVNSITVTTAGVNYKATDANMSAAASNIGGTGSGLVFHISALASNGLSTTGNRWFIDAERLIRCRAKYEIAVHTLRDYELAARMSPYAPQQGQPSGEAYEAYQMLNAEVNRLQARGMIRAVQF